jgi:hypothetical protein
LTSILPFRWGIVALAAVLLARAPAWGELIVSPGKVELADAYSGRQLLVRGQAGDATSRAKFVSSDPKVALVDAEGFVAPVGDGAAEIAVECDGERIAVPVAVSGVSQGRAVDFATEIVPILSRYGCNSGGCHGKASGQNGFKLSLFGFDQAADYDALVKEARGRRVFPAAPDRSLILMKAVAATPHGGGARFDKESQPYKLLRGWIDSGAPPAKPDAPRVVRLEVTPREQVMGKNGQQQLAVEAIYSDGARRDVTRQAQYATNLDVVGTVNETGRVQAHGQSGEAAIMARFMGYVAVFRAIVPHGDPLAEIPNFQPKNYIDELAAAKWKKLGLLPSPACDDATFIRRVSVDLCGRLPTADEARAFLDDTSADKRDKLIDRLLDSPHYPAYFAMRWGSILRNSRLAGADQAAYAFHNWIKDQIARNRPYDELVRGVVAASGEWQDAPAINWYWQSRDDQLHQVTADTAQVFLGIRLQCAKCHHHPYERWGQEDYYGLAGFFTRLGRKSFGQPPPYFAAANSQTGEKNPLTDRTPEPKFLDGEYGKFTPEDDPRHALVDWMTKPENPFFARVMVNRLWGHFMGRGLVHEVDDLRESNPPSNPELLDALAKDFVDHKFDVKHMIKLIVSSRVYQLSCEPTAANKDDRQNFARFYARRFIAEVLHDALDQTCGTRTNFGGVASTARAVDLPHEGFGSYFLDTFDRPRRVTGCECERSSGATLAQVLLLANSDEIENKIGSGEGRVAKAITSKKPIPEVIEDLYLTAYARRPSEAERQATVSYVDSQENKQQALEDVLWTIVNTKEFGFNH